MQSVSQERQTLSIKSMQSTLSKLENAYKNMTEKGLNTALVQKRWDAVKIGLNSLENAWQGTEFSYEEETILEARNVLVDILPSIEKQYEKANDGSSQKTLLERRITSTELAIDALDAHIK